MSASYAQNNTENIVLGKKINDSPALGLKDLTTWQAK
jgi:hypothetical protein